ncbi:MAG: tetratricopeptide repeat protein [Nitrospiraceae bacterium]|jgi:tetratricopeptide (TPR) repeat protein|nr:MAG: tetratricopeptide repeat protein [Nitrospiraceae bacterium]
METNEFFEEGKRLFVEGKMEESIDSFTKALESGYDPKMSHLSRGAAYIKLKEPDKALGDFDKVIALDKNNARAYYYRGMANVQKRDFEKAAADFSKAIALKPDDGASVFARAAAYIELGDTEKAVADIKSAANYLAAAVQGYASTIGDRTHLDKVLAVLEGERREKDLEINEDELETIKKWLTGGVSKEES